MSTPWGEKQDAGTYRQIQLWYWPLMGLYEFEYLDQTYQFSELIQVTDMIDSLIRPPPPPSEELELEKTYRGIEIFIDEFGLYRFTVDDEIYQFSTIELAEGFIDRLLDIPDEPPPPPPEIIPTTVSAPKLPWYANWLKPITEYIGSLTEAVVNFFAPIFEGINRIPANLMNLPSGIFTSLIDWMLDISLKASESVGTTTAKALEDIEGGSPEFQIKTRGTLATWGVKVLEANVKGILSAWDRDEALDPVAASEALHKMSKDLVIQNMDNWMTHSLLEASTLGQMEFYASFEPMVGSKLGLAEIISRSTLLPLEKGVIRPAEHHYNALYPTEIPASSELIEMVVKEVIPLERFKEEMLKLGFREEWSQYIWDAHFKPPDWTQLLNAYYRGEINREELETLKILVDLDPRFNKIWDAMIEVIPPYSDLVRMRVKEVISIADFQKYLGFHGFDPEWAEKIYQSSLVPPTLSDILTAWRRGIIDEKRVDELMILVDLDPRFKEIFDTRKHSDPSITMTRFMFETGAIDDAKVTELVEREGYYPEYVEPISEFIIRFQERRWRTRYLVQLQRGYAYNVYTEETLKAEVVAAGYTPEVADWMIKTAEVQRSIRVASLRGGKPRILALGDLKKAFIRDRMNSDELRTELLTRGYEINEVDILIELLESDKVFETAGTKKKALTQAELFNAWKYQQITEDMLRTDLLLRGLEQGEVEILINTKKLQWGIEIE